MICPVEIAHDVYAFLAVRGEDAGRVLLHEGRELVLRPGFVSNPRFRAKLLAPRSFARVVEANQSRRIRRIFAAEKSNE